jgi:hypothetical protein
MKKMTLNDRQPKIPKSQFAILQMKLNEMMEVMIKEILSPSFSTVYECL